MFIDWIKLTRLKNIQSVFINNLKRYFLLDENHSRDNKNNCQIISTCNWNNNINIKCIKKSCFNNWWTNYICNIWIGNIRKRYRHCKNHNRTTSFKTQQKKAVPVVPNDRYDILKDNIFTTFASSIVTSSTARPEEIPSLIFDRLGVHQAEPNHYEEAKKHFKRIKILKRFEELEQRVTEFNKDLGREDEKITEIVSNYIKSKGFGISNNPFETPKENTILINYLIPALKLFW